MMIGRAIEQIFIRCYTVIKLNIIFVGLMFCGGIVLGVGPAFSSITQLAFEEGFAYKEITWKKAFSLFKEDFKRGNALFYLFAGAFILLAYNLFLVVQMKGIVFFVITFVLAFCLCVLILGYFFALITNTRYDTTFKNILNLSIMAFFSNFFTLIKMILGFAVIAFLTYKYPALLLFGMEAIAIFFTLFITRGVYEMINKKFELE
jgi:uncharacterized membrane protein YesL